jgi:hypothetical protein
MRQLHDRLYPGHLRILKLVRSSPSSGCGLIKIRRSTSPVVGASSGSCWYYYQVGLKVLETRRLALRSTQKVLLGQRLGSRNTYTTSGQAGGGCGAAAGGSAAAAAPPAALAPAPPPFAPAGHAPAPPTPPSGQPPLPALPAGFECRLLQMCTL